MPLETDRMISWGSLCPAGSKELAARGMGRGGVGGEGGGGLLRGEEIQGHRAAAAVIPLCGIAIALPSQGQDTHASHWLRIEAEDTLAGGHQHVLYAVGIAGLDLEDSGII